MVLLLQKCPKLYIVTSATLIHNNQETTQTAVTVFHPHKNNHVHKNIYKNKHPETTTSTMIKPATKMMSYQKSDDEETAVLMVPTILPTATTTTTTTTSMEKTHSRYSSRDGDN